MSGTTSTKIWSFLKQKNNLLILIVILLLLGLGTTVYFQHKKILNLKQENQIEVKLKDALLDSTNFYRNQKGEWVAEKLTLQDNIKNLNGMTAQLTASQKELLARIAELNSKNTIIAAALIESNVTIDSLKNHNKPIVDTTNKNITFSDSTKNLKYKINVGNVMPVIKLTPTLTFQSLTLPNTQFIEFHWRNDKKIGYPVAFSVTNTNDYFRTINIDSYIIPEIQKPALKPTFWQKVGNFFTKSSNKWIWFGTGGLAGAEVFHLLTK